METIMKDESKAIISRFIVLAALFAILFALTGIARNADIGTIARQDIASETYRANE